MSPHSHPLPRTLLTPGSKHRMAQRKTSPKSAKPKAGSNTPQPQRGMPAEDSIKQVVEFISPQGVPHKILKTTETDAYDPPLPNPKKGRRRRDPSKS